MNDETLYDDDRELRRMKALRDAAEQALDRAELRHVDLEVRLDKGGDSACIRVKVYAEMRSPDERWDGFKWNSTEARYDWSRDQPDLLAMCRKAAERLNRRFTEKLTKLHGPERAREDDS